jgi:DNA polymerase (family 10)
VPREALHLDNDSVAHVLDEIADLLELKGENVFRAVTYRAAARAIRDLREPLADLIEQKRLKEVPKVGPSVSEAIEQLVSTGRSKRHEELQAAVPTGLLTLLRVPGVGPATARTIYDHLRSRRSRSSRRPRSPAGCVSSPRSRRGPRRTS